VSQTSPWIQLCTSTPENFEETQFPNFRATNLSEPLAFFGYEYLSDEAARST
jgi:hypothetical protein